MLEESGRQALTAVDCYNRSGDGRSFFDFVVHMHLAWLYLLHAEFERGGVDYFYRDKPRRFIRLPEGDRKTWDLQRCVRERFTEGDPVRSNIEFFIGLRNKIEHRYQGALLTATAGRAHAWVINYESERIARFGREFSLSRSLRFPVFVQSLTPEGMEEQRRLRRKLPAAARTYITRFEARLPDVVRSSESFDYRVLLTPLKGPKSDADLAVAFLRAEDFTEERRAELERQGQLGTVVVAEKQRNVMHKDELAPEEARRAIEERLPFKFNRWHFTELWRRTDPPVRPPNGAPEPERTDTRYCLYDKPFGKYVWTQRGWSEPSMRSGPPKGSGPSSAGIRS